MLASGDQQTSIQNNCCLYRISQCRVLGNSSNQHPNPSVSVVRRDIMSQLAQIPPGHAAFSEPQSRFVTPLWWTMLIFSLAVVGYGITYFLSSPRDDHFGRYIFTLRLHIAGGMGALLAGPWQFSRKLRARRLNLHRWMGRFYLLSVALGSIAGFAMALVSEQGLPTHFGFGILAVLWFATALQAYRSIRRGEIDAHRQWMIRNFALSLAAVTLRIYMPLMLGIFHWPFRATYITVSWLCWIPNLLIAEWIIARGETASISR
jgi:uncharacterized membrane protein